MEANQLKYNNSAHKAVRSGSRASGGNQNNRNAQNPSTLRGSVLNDDLEHVCEGGDITVAGAEAPDDITVGM